ncbi:hypothetical protein HMPREF1345_00336 [Enterococcus faecium TX1337RF]|nr:hypothetical protein HMPREF1345_00336 [Enterococcus faecium TX1337RF]
MMAMVQGLHIMLMSLFQMISKLYQKQLNIWKQLVYLFSRRLEKG